MVKYMKSLPPKLKPVIEIRDPVHGYIELTEIEKNLIDTVTFQRLHNIRQLAGAYYVYPGADHTRFIHSIGVAHVAGLYGSHLMELGYLDIDEVQAIRIAGLLHDIGHGPFSHLYEELAVRYIGKTHEDLTVWLIRESELADILKDFGYDPKKIAELAIGMLKNGKEFMNHIISSAFDADKLDFLVRDSLFTGVEYGYIDIQRIVSSSDVIDNMLCVRVPAAAHALESLFIARYEMFKAVYFHRTVRICEVMLLKSMELAHEYIGLFDFKEPEEYILLDDDWVLTKLKELCLVDEKKLSKEEKEAVKLFKMLQARKLLKCVYETYLHLHDPLLADILSRPDVKLRIEREIAEKARVPEDCIFVDTPSVPSLPYTPRMRRPFIIPVFKIVNGKKILYNFLEESIVLERLKGYIDIARVYTYPKYRSVVEKVARKILGSPSALLSISL